MHADDADNRDAGSNQPTRDIDTLAARRDAAYFQLDTSIVATSAEQPVMLSRINDLAADTDRARQRLADAHDHLVAVDHHPDPDIIAAARREVDARRDELDRITLANTNETTALIDQGLANLDRASRTRTRSWSFQGTCARRSPSPCAAARRGEAGRSCIRAAGHGAGLPATLPLDTGPGRGMCNCEDLVESRSGS